MVRQKGYLLFPWGLLSIVTILTLSVIVPDWIGANWEWVIFVLIIPAGILENLKSGYSSIKVMFRKIVYTMMSFLFVGVCFGLWAYNYYFSKVVASCPSLDFEIPWFVFLAVGIVLIIEVVNVFSLLKAALREIGTLS